MFVIILQGIFTALPGKSLCPIQKEPPDSIDNVISTFNPSITMTHTTSHKKTVMWFEQRFKKDTEIRETKQFKKNE